MVARVLGWLGYVYMRFCYLSSRVYVTDALDESLKQSWDRGVPTVMVCWHDEFLTSLLTIQTSRLRRVLFITNDSFGGIFLETFCRHLGANVQIIRMKTPRQQRILAMAEGLKAHGAMAIAADYGRPWFKARPTAGELARLTDGLVVACRCEPKRKLRIGWGDHRAYLPLPFNEYAIHAGQPRQPSELSPAVTLDDDLDRLRESSAFA